MVKPANPEGFMENVREMLAAYEGGHDDLMVSAIRSSLKFHDEAEVDPACGNETCPNYGWHPPWLDCTTWTKGD